MNWLLFCWGTVEIQKGRTRTTKWGKRAGFFDKEARKQAAEEKQTMLQFKQAVYLLEEDAEDFANCTLRITTITTP
jgi:hypothetical protein